VFQTFFKTLQEKLLSIFKFKFSITIKNIVEKLFAQKIFTKLKNPKKIHSIFYENHGTSSA